MATLIWRRGLRGPSPALALHDQLDETDRARKLLTYKLKEGDERLTLGDLAKLYPPPKDDDEAPAVHPLKP